MKRVMALLVFGVISVAVAAGPVWAPVWACDAAGPNTHVGVVTTLNAKERQFTIKDAQTGKPMVFVADSKQMAALNIGDQIAVKYEDHDGKMLAKQIQ
jgi:Cu/Ag efflux protein CusF